MIHGEFDTTVGATTYTDAQLAAFAARGIVVTADGDQVTLEIRLAAAFGTPDLLEDLGLEPVFLSHSQRQYGNDEQTDNAPRTVLSDIPYPCIARPPVRPAP